MDQFLIRIEDSISSLKQKQLFLMQGIIWPKIFLFSYRKYHLFFIKQRFFFFSVKIFKIGVFKDGWCQMVHTQTIFYFLKTKKQSNESSNKIICLLITYLLQNENPFGKKI